MYKNPVHKLTGRGYGDTDNIFECPGESVDASRSGDRRPRDSGYQLAGVGRCCFGGDVEA